MPSEHESLREELGALKPHPKDRLPLGDLLSEAEMDAIIEVIKQHDKYVIGEKCPKDYPYDDPEAVKYFNILIERQNERAQASYGTDKEEDNE